MLLLCKSQGNGFAFICLNLLKASPLTDSRKGCPYKRSVIDSSRILCRSRGIGASRSPHPTCCASINLCRFRGRMIFAHIANFFTIHFYLLLSTKRNKPLSRSATAPLQRRLNIFYNDTQFTHQQNQPAQSLYQAGWLSLLSVRRRV